MSRINIEDLLDRYSKGQASAEEINRVESWLDEHGNHGAEWQQMDKTGRDKWLSGLFSDIQESAGLDHQKVVTMPSRRNIWRSIAAVAAVLAVFFTIYVEWPAIHDAWYPVKLTALNVQSDQKKQIILADGSTINVNSSSQLKYPGAFDGKTRNVYLSGEAYFDIQHDASKPFIIHAGKVIITVLGTAFDVKEDQIQHTIVVTVLRGKVSVANGNEPLGAITPNQQISYNTISHRHTQLDVDAKEAIAWQENDIHFNDITFGDAAKQLAQKFNVKISFTSESVKNSRFTGTVSKQESLDEILRVICNLNNASYETKADGSTVISGTR